MSFTVLAWTEPETSICNYSKWQIHLSFYCFKPRAFFSQQDCGENGDTISPEALSFKLYTLPCLYLRPSQRISVLGEKKKKAQLWSWSLFLVASVIYFCPSLFHTLLHEGTACLDPVFMGFNWITHPGLRLRCEIFRVLASLGVPDTWRALGYVALKRLY